jgi:hypothetical protein
MSVGNLASPVPIIQLCYVRLAVSQPQAAATFATEVLGLEHVPNKLEPFLYRSDARYHTLCLSAGAAKPSIGIEINNESDLDQAAKALARAGFSAREATSDECAQRFVRRALIVVDTTGNEIDLVLRPALSGRRYRPGRRNHLSRHRPKTSPRGALPIRQGRPRLCLLRRRKHGCRDAKQLFRPGAADQDRARTGTRADIGPDLPAICRT